LSREEGVGRRKEGRRRREEGGRCRVRYRVSEVQSKNEVVMAS
jgi:hypothetical protein